LQIKIFHVTALLLITFAINLWHQKFITAGITAVYINDQHGIPRRLQDFNYKKHINTPSIHSYTCRGFKIGALKIQFVCIFFHIWYYRWISKVSWILSCGFC